MHVRRPIRRSLAVLAVVAAILGSATVRAPGSGAQADCAQPYSPMWVEHHSGPAPPPQPWPPYPHDRPFHVNEVGSAGGPQQLPLPAAIAELVIDTDGDGAADGVTEESGSDVVDHIIRIDRSDGTVRLHVDLVEFDRAGRAIRAVGDLDGDGRSEVLIGTHLVPGSVGPGRHDLADVSIAMPSSAVLPVGDQDGDGTFDLVVGTVADPSGSAYVVDGPAALAPGPGGNLGDLGPTAIPGEPGALIDLGSGPPAVAVASEGVLTVVHGDEVVRYEIRHFLNDWNVGVVTFEGRHYLSLWSVLSSVSYRGAFSFWDLDDPCRRLPNTAPTPPPTTGRADCLCAPPVPGRPLAAPASPVRAAPAYAG